MCPPERTMLKPDLFFHDNPNPIPPEQVLLGEVSSVLVIADSEGAALRAWEIEGTSQAPTRRRQGSLSSSPWSPRGHCVREQEQACPSQERIRQRFASTLTGLSVYKHNFVSLHRYCSVSWDPLLTHRPDCKRNFLNLYRRN